MVQRKVAALPVFQATQIGIHDRRVALEREDQRDVDVHALRDQRANGRDAGLRGGDLDHQVGAVHRRPEAARLGNGLVRVVGQVRGHFQADEAVAAAGCVVHRAQYVRRVADVGDSQLFEDGGRSQVAARQPAQVLLVGVTGRDSLLKDGRIGRDAAQTGVDQLVQFPGLQHTPVDIVQPDALSEFVKFVYATHLAVLLVANAWTLLRFVVRRPKSTSRGSCMPSTQTGSKLPPLTIVAILRQYCSASYRLRELAAA